MVLLPHISPFGTPGMTRSHRRLEVRLSVSWLVWLVFLLAASPCPAAEAPPLTAKAVSVEESRRSGTRPGQCNVVLEFSGAGLDNQTLVTGLVIDRAVDDTGHDLLRQSPQVIGRQRLRSGDARTEWTLPLLPTTRSAEDIRLIEGSVTLQTVTDEDTLDLDLASLMKQHGEYLQSTALADRGVRLAYLDEASFEEKGANLLIERFLKGRQRTEEQRKEMINASLLGPMRIALSRPNFAILLLDAPEDTVLGLALAASPDAKAKPLRPLHSGMFLIQDEHDGTMRVRLQFKSEAGEQQVPFRVEDIELP